MFEDESWKLFEYLDKNKNGKLKYQDFSSCFACNEISKNDLKDAEMKFLSHPVEEIMRANSVSHGSKSDWSS